MNEWPALPLAAWRETRDTLHMYTQIVGKIRLKLAPYLNHWWQVPFYLTPRGLTTGRIPATAAGAGTALEIEFDFIEHVLVLAAANGGLRRIPLRPRPLAAFYAEVMAALATLGCPVHIWPVPSEVPSEVAGPVRFDQDQRSAYDPVYAERFWRILLAADGLLQQFRGGFIGKASPVHFFWGGFDLAATRFSGRLAPPRPGADAITREGYSHEVSSCGFWPGGGSLDGPAFYSYAAPEPAGFPAASVRPAAAFYSPEFGNYLLRYDDIRTAPDRCAQVLDFFQSTYQAAADLGHWDRPALEHQIAHH